MTTLQWRVSDHPGPIDAAHARGDRFTPCCSRALSPRLDLDL